MISLFRQSEEVRKPGMLIDEDRKVYFLCPPLCRQVDRVESILSIRGKTEHEEFTLLYGAEAPSLLP